MHYSMQPGIVLLSILFVPVLHAEAPPDYWPVLPTSRLQPPGKNVQEKLTDADRISRLKRNLEGNQQRMQELQLQLDRPSKEYVETEEKFKRLDVVLQKRKSELSLLASDKETEKQEARQTVERLEKEIAPVRDRFNQLLQDRKLQVEKVANLKELIRLDETALNELLGTPTNTAKTPIPTVTKQDTAPSVSKSQNSTPIKDLTLPSVVPGVPQLPSAVSTQPTQQQPVPLTPEIREAQEQAKAKQLAADKARTEAESFVERMEVLRKNIEIERSLLESAKRNADQEQKRHDDMVVEQDKKLQLNPSPENWQQAWKQRTDSTKRLAVARRDMRESADRLEVMQQQLSQLQADELSARKEALRKQREAVDAEQKVVQLQNPFTLKNIQNWLMQHSVRLIAIIVGMYLLRKMLLLFGRRIVTFVSHHQHRGSEVDRVNRAETLVDVFRNTVSMLIIVGGILMIGDEIGVPITPLLGGAAMLALAVAFGAQNLIRDYFTGFMILLEDQYAIKDVVKIGNISGMVEKITLRMTVLRDLEGVLHFIPHGTITTVSNLTHGWSRAMLDINIPLDEDPDRIMELLRDIAIDMRKDARFGQLIIEDPEMLGVENISNAGITIRFLIKTLPLQQWTVKRELLRRIKQRFDLLKIEVPLPEQILNVRNLPPEEAA